MQTFSFRAKIWLYPGEGGWHFITLPQSESNLIREMYGQYARGFGSVRVEARVGRTKWRTSIFPDKTSGGYILPVKAAVRGAEKIKTNDAVVVELRPLT